MTTSLFLHSTATMPAMWSGVPDDVIGDTHKLAPTNLGYPPNPLLARGTPASAHDDAAAILAALPEGDVHIYAHSYGGTVALTLIEALGPRLKSLFLFEPVLFGALLNDRSVDTGPEGLAEAEALRDARPWFLDDAHGGDEAWIELFIDYWNRPGTWQRMPPAQQAWTRQVAWKMYQEVKSVFTGMTRFDAFPLRVPTTLVTGERSPKAAQAMVRALAQVNPGVRVVTLEGAGHMAPLTHAAKVNALMQEHVQAMRS